MRPVLLLIPGMNNTPKVWEPVRACLRSDVEVRVTDVRSSADIPSMAVRAWKDLADIEPSRPLALAGFSMGGYVALHMIATAPRPVQALAMVCSSARPDDPASAPMRERAIAAAQRDWERYITGIANYLTTPHAQSDSALMETIRADLREAGMAPTIAQHRAVAARPDHRSMLPSLRLSALVIAGALDPLIPPALSREIADAVPGARWLEVAGVGHLLPWEQPATLAHAIDEWLEPLTCATSNPQET
jgi:pimeloyl-ACP methyl ester carboxylesterase